MKVWAFIAVWLVALPVGAVCLVDSVDIPPALAAKNTEICTALASRVPTDTGTLTNQECALALMRLGLATLAREFKRSDVESQVSEEEQTVRNAWSICNDILTDCRVCGDNELDTGETCDGTQDAACPGLCGSDPNAGACQCPP